MDIEIPFEYASTGKYQATLGHKMNHNFDPGTIVEVTETARYDFRFNKCLPKLPRANLTFTAFDLKTSFQFE